MKKLTGFIALILLSTMGRASARSLSPVALPQSQLVIFGNTLVNGVRTPNHFVSCNATFTNPQGAFEMVGGFFPETRNTAGTYSMSFNFNSSGPGNMAVSCFGMDPNIGNPILANVSFAITLSPSTSPTRIIHLQ